MLESDVDGLEVLVVDVVRGGVWVGSLGEKVPDNVGMTLVGGGKQRRPVVLRSGAMHHDEMLETGGGKCA